MDDGEDALGRGDADDAVAWVGATGTGRCLPETGLPDEDDHAVGMFCACAGVGAHMSSVPAAP